MDVAWNQVLHVCRGARCFRIDMTSKMDKTSSQQKIGKLHDNNNVHKVPGPNHDSTNFKNNCQEAIAKYEDCRKDNPGDCNVIEANRPSCLQGNINTSSTGCPQGEDAASGVLTCMICYDTEEVNHVTSQNGCSHIMCQSCAEDLILQSPEQLGAHTFPCPFCLENSPITSGLDRIS